MIDPERLCLGCMERLSAPGARCEKCGFERTEYERTRNTGALPSYTILAGKYLLGRVLGAGGFGITYIAWDLNRECKVAIKEYFPTGLASRDVTLTGNESVSVMTGKNTEFYMAGMRSFVREGQNLLRFQDLDGIVSVRDFFEDNRTAYLVMDYVEGENLKQYIRKFYGASAQNRFMDETEVLRMMRPVLNALTEMHKEGVIHRDISPENIICGPDGKVTLIDFGAARMAAGNETKSLTVVLKHGYAPPEQYQSHGNQGPWTDVYAICATMYHMLTGILPAESIDRVFTDELVPVNMVNPTVSEAVSEAIRIGMNVRWEERFQSVEELAEILYPSVAEETGDLSAFKEMAQAFDPAEEEVGQDASEDSFPAEESLERSDGFGEEKDSGETRSAWDFRAANEALRDSKKREKGRFGKRILSIFIIIAVIIGLACAIRYDSGMTGSSTGFLTSTETIKFKDGVALNNDYCKLTIESAEKSKDSYTLNVEIKNNSDKKYAFNVDNGSEYVDGVAVFVDMGILEIDPGETAEGQIRFYGIADAELDDENIFEVLDFTDLQLSVCVLDITGERNYSEVWMSKPFHVYPYGKDNAVTYE